MGTSFSQSASQWPPPTWHSIFTAAPVDAAWSATRLFQSWVLLERSYRLGFFRPQASRVPQDR